LRIVCTFDLKTVDNDSAVSIIGPIEHPTNSNDRNTKLKTGKKPKYVFEIGLFGFGICWGFRYWDLGFSISPLSVMVMQGSKFSFSNPTA